LIVYFSEHLEKLLAVGCWLLAVGCWLLAVGCWLLAVGCCDFSKMNVQQSLVLFWANNITIWLNSGQRNLGF
jgi:hypothetical protein